jgi:hypothetical protein
VKNNSRAWFVFLTLLVVYGYFFPRWAEWNQNSRFDLVLAVVDKGTLKIDDYRQNTGDYAAFENHYYSDKAPGTSFLGIPVYAVFKIVVAPIVNNFLPRLASNAAFADTLRQEGSGLLTDKIYFFIALTVVTFFAVAVPSALMGALFYDLLGEFTTSEWRKLGLTFAFAVATPAFAYSNLFYGHQIAAFCLFVAFYIMFHWRKHQRARDLALVGFLFAFALITEYPIALMVAGVGIYTLVQTHDWRKWIWIAVGGIVPLALAAAYNYAIFRTPLPVGYEHSELWQDVHQQGFFSITAPNAEAFWGITFGVYRGLFFLAPFLLLAFPGLYYFWRAKKFRAEFWVTLWCVAIFFLFNGSSVMWSGGFSVGPRYLVPMLPFLALPIVFALDAIRAQWFTMLAGVLAVWSFGVTWVETIGGQMYPQLQPSPLFEYSLPRVLAGDVARNAGMILGLRGGLSLLPLIVLVALIAWLFMRGNKNLARVDLKYVS